MNRETPPLRNEFEVSILGPGKGECVVLHLGDNAWCVVDSYTDPVSRQPAATQYLNSLNCNALEGVKLVVATHWHDDHIRGLSELLKYCPNADFCCSSALRCSEFATLVQASLDSGQQFSGVDELGAILALLVQRRNRVPKQNVTPKLALQNRVLLQFESTDPRMQVSITAMSPADATLSTAIAEFAKWLPEPGQEPTTIPYQSGNQTSVVLWVKLGSQRVLLGADLEHTGIQGEGWLAAISGHLDPLKANVYKVPHHGSLNGDHDDIWSRLLHSDPISVITPFSSGRKLPQTSDLARVRGRTQNLYCTATGTRRLPRRANNVERLLKGYERRVIESDAGHVRIRWSSTNGDFLPKVELFGRAYKVA